VKALSFWLAIVAGAGCSLIAPVDDVRAPPASGNGGGAMSGGAAGGMRDGGLNDGSTGGAGQTGGANGSGGMATGAGGGSGAAGAGGTVAGAGGSGGFAGTKGTAGGAGGASGSGGAGGAGGACNPETDAALCTRLGKYCGSTMAMDNCGTNRTVVSCGSCAPSTAFPGGSCGSVTPNVCGCPTAAVAGWVCINPGTFRIDDGTTPHTVNIGGPFWMKATEVTQGEWQSVMGNNPTAYPACGPNCPVERVSWYMAVAYTNVLSSREGFAGCYTRPGGGTYTTADATAFLEPVWSSGVGCPHYRLPTEAEWEFATRAGTTTALYTGPITVNACTPIDPNMDAAGWYCGNTTTGPHPAGLKRPNPWGLYDALGNVLEWVWDWYGPYTAATQTDPLGVASGPGRVTRGGSFAVGGPQYCSSGFRNYDDPALGTGNGGAGIRLVRSIR
jgi:formylglycine-generating enzyme required for sulfatase activity